MSDGGDSPSVVRGPDSPLPQESYGDPPKASDITRDLPSQLDEPTPAPTEDIPKEVASFDPDTFVAKYGGSRESQPQESGGFNPDRFIQKYEGTSDGDSAGLVPSFAKGFDPESFINKYEGTSEEQPKNTIEEAKAFAEAVSQGAAGDLAKAAEVTSGLSTLPAIERREVDYPTARTIGKVVGRVPPMALAGSSLLGNVLLGVSYAGSDAIAKSLLGQPGGDPQTAVATFLANGSMDVLMNVATHGLFKGLAYPYKNMPDLSQKAMQWLATRPISKALMGMEIASGAHAIATHTVPKFLVGEGLYFAGYNAIKQKLHPIIRQVLGNTRAEADKWAGDAILNAMSKTNYLGVPAAARYAQDMTAGAAKIARLIEPLFKSGAQEHLAPTKNGMDEKIRKWMEGGGIINEYQDYHFGGGGASDLSHKQSPQVRPAFADGGDVEPEETESNLQQSSSPEDEDHFSRLYPTENILLNQSRGRISNYLNSIRPTDLQFKAPFDAKTPQVEKERSYGKAIELAANPSSILEHVNKATLTPEHMTHFKAMYPEVYELFSKKMTERIIKAQLKDEKPPYSKVKAMSMFLGTDLDSTTSQRAIQAIQMTYLPKQAPQQPTSPKSKKSTSPLSKLSTSYMTDEQAREQRMQTQKA